MDLLSSCATKYGELTTNNDAIIAALRARVCVKPDGRYNMPDTSIVLQGASVQLTGRDHNTFNVVLVRYYFVCTQLYSFKFRIAPSAILRS